MVDNYFVTDGVLGWAGNAGLGIIGTNVSNRLPNDIEQLWLHKEKTNTTMKHTKAVILFDPVVAVENYYRVFQRVHVSFQSISSFNIEFVNALNESTNFVELHEKVKREHKQQWVV